MIDKKKLANAAAFAGFATLIAFMGTVILAAIGMILYGLFVHLTIPTVLILGFFSTVLGIFYFKPEVLDMILDAMDKK